MSTRMANASLILFVAFIFGLYAVDGWLRGMLDSRTEHGSGLRDGWEMSETSTSHRPHIPDEAHAKLN